MNARKPGEGPRQSLDNGLQANVDVVFQDNLMRHALEETVDKWLEMNIRQDTKATLFCVTNAMVAKLGKNRVRVCLGNLVVANRTMLKRLRIEEDKKRSDEAQGEYQVGGEGEREAAEAVWKSLGRGLQDAIRAHGKRTVPTATDEDLKAAAYELVSELYNRTNAWAKH